MPPPSTPGQSRPRSVAGWTALIALSLAGSAILLALGIPAALLLGPMLAGIAITSAGGRLQVPSPAFVFAQGLIGCMIARLLPAWLSGGFGGQWPLFLLGVPTVIAASGLLGWLMTRLRVLPGTTALWGLSPGAATAMVLMAEAYGADAQLVAFMQYLRVVVVAAIASTVARLWGVDMHHATAHPAWFPAVAWVPLLGTLALTAATTWLGQRLRLPAGALLLPLIAGAVLLRLGWLQIELPPWLLAIAYAVIGWRIGLRFTRPLLAYAAKALPRILACTLALVAACAALAGVLVMVGHIDPMTAYLATSPGGADTAAIIAASTHVDMPFVMGMQMLRFVAVLLLGPLMVRWLAARAEPAATGA